MIVPRYRIATSGITGAGNGVYLDEPVARGRVIIAPDAVNRLIPKSEWERYAPDSLENRSSVRWFEDWYSLTMDWSDECYTNHSAQPTGVWHLGFIFAARDLAPGDELTIDYRFVLGSGEVSDFVCGQTGQRVAGLPWQENLRQSAARLQALLEPV